MNWNDLSSLWSRQEVRRLSPTDLASLQITFETKHRKLARALFWRDTRESVALLFVVAVLINMRWHGKLALWPFAAALTILLGLLVFFIKERIRAHHNRVPPGVPLLAKLEADIAELKHQRYLLLNVAKWYLAPIIVSWAIIVVASFLATVAQHRSHPFFLACYVVVCSFLFFGVWALNHRAVRKTIEPRLEELERLRSALLST